MRYRLCWNSPNWYAPQVIAPSLQVFHFVHFNRCNVAVNMNIRACRMVREFPVGFDNEHFISDFPHLENLVLGPCEISKCVKISSPSLRKLTLIFTQLYNYNTSRKSVVLVLNLCSFQYVGRTFKSFLAPSETQKLLNTINIFWFLMLRRSIEFGSSN